MVPPRSRIRALLLALIVGACGVPRAFAHDIPNARIERSTQVILGPGRLGIVYEVVLAELTLAQDLRQLDGEAFVGDRPALFERYARVVGPLNARGFVVRVDDREIDLEPVDFAIAVEDHPRFRFEFAAPIPGRGRLSLLDTNYASAEGTTRLAAAIDPRIDAIGDLPPARIDDIPLRAAWQLTEPEDRRSKGLILTYSPRSEPAPSPAVAAGPPPAAARPRSSGLTRLLDDGSGGRAVGWWLTAFVLGMVHAIQPGHGKTLVAAASLDGAGSFGRGARLGLITAGCHLVGVVALAGVLWMIPTRGFAPIHLAIARAAGFVIAAVGLFRAGRYLAGIDAAHAHPAGTALGTWSLGLAAGFVPCWDAVALVVLAGSIGRLAWGLGLLVAFSLGLAAVLVAVGWAAGRIRRSVAGRERAGRGGRWLGLASGLVLAAIGVGLLNS